MRFPIMEGFDHYPATQGVGGLDSAWNNYALIPAAGFFAGLGGDGQCLRMGTSGSQSGYSQPIPDANKLTIHWAFKIGGGISVISGEFIQLCTASAGHQFGIGMDATGHLNVVGEANAIVATSAFAAIPNQVYRCCFQADLTTGNIRCSINGDDDAGLHQNGLDIQDDPVSNLCSLFRFHQWGGLDAYMDDLIVGIDECVDWGPQELNTLAASADVVAAWTRSAGATNFSNVDDLPFTGDTDYNTSSVVGQKDVFEYNNPPHTPASILAVQLMTIARKEESAVRKFREFLRIGGVDYNGDEHNLAETYGRWFSTWVVNPATGLAWTAGELNALQGGYEPTVVA